MSIASSDTSVPTISVLLPVHNGERYLRKAIESILVQSFGDFELLALDDGSTDCSLSILRKCAAKDKRMRVASRENRGITSTLNELIAAARGRYLARMDSDDICRPRRFERQLLYLEAHPTCVAVGTKTLFIDPEGMPLFEFGDKFVHDDIDAAHLSGSIGSRICHPSVMMRAEAVVRVGGYSEDYRFAQDLDLFLRLAEIGKLANLPEVLLEYRHHLKSVGYRRAGEQRDFAIKAVRAAWARRGIANTPEIAEMKIEPETIDDLHHRWAWWAMSAGNVNTARKHAIKALAKNPFSIKNLQTVYCTIRGR